MTTPSPAEIEALCERLDSTVPVDSEYGEQAREAAALIRSLVKERESDKALVAEAKKVIEPFGHYTAYAVHLDTDTRSFQVSIAATIENQPQMRHFDAARAWLNGGRK